MAYKELTDASFKEEVLDSDKVVLVDFWAPWCMPCQVLGPIIEEIAEEMEEKVVVGKMNIDENPQTPGDYQVMGIPTVILFKDGKEVEKFVGVQPKENYVEAVEKATE